ncbi:MAG: VIT domain-containing protein, partial [Pseudomonadota bacterium]
MTALARLCAPPLLVAALAALFAPSVSRAIPDPTGPREEGGRLEAEVDGRMVSLPALKTEIEADIAGQLATVTVRQVFENPGQVPLNATYLFPLNRNAAVHAMTMEVGEERVRAVIKEKAEARRTFET